MSRIYRVVLRTVMFVRANNKEEAKERVFEDDFITLDTQIDSITVSSKKEMSNEMLEPTYFDDIFVV